jgi:hypothetical protein
VLCRRVPESPTTSTRGPRRGAPRRSANPTNPGDHAGSSITGATAAPDDPVSRVEDWVTAWVDQLADGLMAGGAASLSTPRGSVDAWLRRPRGVRRGELRIEVAGRGVSGGSVRSGLRGDDQKLRREVHDYLTFAVLDLTGM